MSVIRISTRAFIGAPAAAPATHAPAQFDGSVKVRTSALAILDTQPLASPSAHATASFSERWETPRFIGLQARRLTACLPNSINAPVT
jgi:hypothetical protein